jgi:hypothetical protein
MFLFIYPFFQVFFLFFIISKKIFFVSCWFFFLPFFGFFPYYFLGFLYLIILVCVCVCVWGGGGGVGKKRFFVLVFKILVCVLGFILTTKEGFTFFILALACRFDFGALISCLSFVAYHSINNDCFVTFLILI